uniref:Uncharacterized protein n=1 Tax=Plectus sambesii TaxID=2011161 RepID=A0A914VIV9_9BILA
MAEKPEEKGTLHAAFDKTKEVLSGAADSAQRTVGSMVYGVSTEESSHGSSGLHLSGSKEKEGRKILEKKGEQIQGALSGTDD